MDHTYFLPLVEQNIRPTLGAKVANQFIRAIEKPLDEFNDRFIWRHLSHICVSDTVREPGRTHQLAHAMRDEGVTNWPDYRRELTYWTNTMVMAEKYAGADGKEHWVEPSRRVVGGFPYVFTLEWDVADIDFLKTQMSWCRSSGKPIDAPLGGLYRELSRYADFMGITVCWSGNKSLHIHVMFDSYPVSDRLKLDRRAMRDGFKSHWDRVVEITKSVLGIPDDLQPDAMLKYPEAFRRIPWGTRIIGRDAKEPKPNILGMPVGTAVPQATLWETYRNQRATAADELFFQPGPFLRTTDADGAGGRKVGIGSGSSERLRSLVGSGETAIRPSPLPEEDRLYCETRLRQHCGRKWGAWPKLYRLDWISGHWVASFYNSQHDGRASSIIRDDYAHLMMCGRDAWKDRSPPPLDFKLGVLMALWLKERRTSHDLNLPEVEQEDLVTWIDPVRSRPLSEVELAFQAGATTKDKVQDLTRRAVLESVRDNPLTYLRGPEGAGKTRGLLDVFDQIVRESGGQEKIHMMAFGNYDAAAEKAREFNVVQNRNGYHAVVVAAWEREYRDVCRKLKIQPLTMDDALADGYANLWAMVCDRQPKATKGLEKRHQEVWQEVGKRRLVLMTSHAMMHNWTKWSHSRCFWHRDFWIAHKMKDSKRLESLRAEMQLGLAVHDEVSAGDLLDIHRVEMVDWVRDLKRDCPAWRKFGDTLEKHEGYGDFLDRRGPPLHRGKGLAVDFQTCRRIADGSGKAWREISVEGSREYGSGGRHRSEDIYAEAVGNRWMVRPRNWWAGLARRVVLLTTEIIPTVVASCLPPVKVLGRERDDRQVFRIVELETPLIERDTVRVTFDRGCTAGGVNEVIKRFRDQHGQDFLVISDKAQESDRTITHARAKGSNGLMGRDLMQTMLHVGPAEHETLEVLNAWTGVRSCVRLRHVDAMNQTCGRNLGFRKRGVDPHHWLVLSASLWCKIDAVLVENSRYDFSLHLSQNEVREIRRRQVEFSEPQASLDLGVAEVNPDRKDVGPQAPHRGQAEIMDLISVLLSRTSNSNVVRKEAV